MEARRAFQLDFRGASLNTIDAPALRLRDAS